jgi:hypothetical protein
VFVGIAACLVNVVAGGNLYTGVKQATSQATSATKDVNPSHLDAFSADNAPANGSLFKHACNHCFWPVCGVFTKDFGSDLWFLIMLGC